MPLFVLLGEKPMSKIQEIEKIITPVIESDGMELVDVQCVKEAGKKVLKIFIDKENGIKLDDCENISEKISSLLDDLISDPYILEVSSPGLDRVLKKEKDFVKFIGEKIRVTVFSPIEGQRNFLGKLLSCQSNEIMLNDISGKNIKIMITDIARARLEPEID